MHIWIPNKYVFKFIFSSVKKIFESARWKANIDNFKAPKPHKRTMILTELFKNGYHESYFHKMFQILL